MRRREDGALLGASEPAGKVRAGPCPPNMASAPSINALWGFLEYTMACGLNICVLRLLLRQ
jgi:hypothetical protein